MIDNQIKKWVFTGLIFKLFSSYAYCDEKPEPVYFSLKCNMQLDPQKKPEMATNLLQAVDFQSDTNENGVVKISALVMDSMLDEIGNTKCSPYAYREKTDYIDNYPESKYPSMPQRRDTAYGGLNYKEGQEVEYYPPIVSSTTVTRKVITKRNWNSIKFMPSQVRKEFSCLKESSMITPLYSKEEGHEFLAKYFVQSKFVDSLGFEVALQVGAYTHAECVILE